MIQNVSDGGQIIHIKSTYLESKTIHTDIGNFQTKVIDIDTKGLRGVFKKSPNANVLIYLTDQIPAIPVKFQSKVRVGEFYAILSGGMYEGIIIKGEK